MGGWLVTGAGGMLGRELAALLRGRDEMVNALPRAELDITDPAAAAAAVCGQRPAVVVNCAAWTAVDDAETREEQALAVNGHGPANLAAACRAAGARLIHVSTDYVFSGEGARPWAEDDPPAPRTAYGRTKLAGERAVLRALPAAGYVVRTGWLYGEHGPNFVAAMLRLAARGRPAQVVADQRGQPTWARDVAGRIAALARAGAPPGIYHATSSGDTTWHGLAQEVFRLAGADPGLVRPVSSDQYPRPAPRPRYSVLGHAAWQAAGLPPLPPWQHSLRRAFPTLTP
jgi:dTDP-4-dehydrorhamnose reductase